jgi:hypothetical protein
MTVVPSGNYTTSFFSIGDIQVVAPEGTSTSNFIRSLRRYSFFSIGGQYAYESGFDLSGLLSSLGDLTTISLHNPQVTLPDTINGTLKIYAR